MLCVCEDPLTVSETIPWRGDPGWSKSRENQRNIGMNALIVPAF